MTPEEIQERREELISQGIIIPEAEDEYYNLDDKFDTFSCVTGDYRATPSQADTESISIKVESDLDTDFDSDTETLISQPSTPSNSTNLNGNEPVLADPVGVNNEHEGMNYELLMDGVEVYECNENIIQSGNNLFF